MSHQSTYQELEASMSSNYAFTLEPQRDLLLIRFFGWWTPEVVSRYQIDRGDAVQAMIRLGTPLSKLRVLADTRELATQSQEAIARFKALIAESPVQPYRTALLPSSTLNKMQMQRIGMPSLRAFLTEKDALSWLFSEADNDASS